MLHRLRSRPITGWGGGSLRRLHASAAPTARTIPQQNQQTLQIQRNDLHMRLNSKNCESSSLTKPELVSAQQLGVVAGRPFPCLVQAPQATMAHMYDGPVLPAPPNPAYLGVTAPSEPTDAEGLADRVRRLEAALGPPSEYVPLQGEDEPPHGTSTSLHERVQMLELGLKDLRQEVLAAVADLTSKVDALGGGGLAPTGAASARPDPSPAQQPGERHCRTRRRGCSREGSTRGRRRGTAHAADAGGSSTPAASRASSRGSQPRGRRQRRGRAGSR